MIVRSVFLEGTVAEGDRAEFDRHMQGPVLAALGTYPGLHSVKLRRLLQADVGSPPVYMVFDMCFADLAAMHAALAAPTRQEVRQLMAQMMGRFQGRVFHHVYQQD